MKEIGSDYNIDFRYLNFNKKNINNLYFISCRNAIKFLIKKLNIKNIMLPNYLCESIYNCFVNINIHFYQINNNFEIELETLKNIKYLYIINYFGIIDKNINKIKLFCKNNNIIIIEDFTHNILDNYRYGDICIASYRKTLVSPFGAILIDNLNIINKNNSNNCIFNYLKICIKKIILMMLKNFSFIKFFWYPQLVNCEREINNINYEGNDFINSFFYNLYDFEKIRDKRIMNYNFLKKHIILNTIVSNNVLYFCFPIVLKNKKTRDRLRLKLVENKIYCPIYWDNSFNENCNIKLSEKLLFIPIDQRYNINDMKRICEIINNFDKFYI